MTHFRYTLRSIGYFWRTHLGVALGAAVATAVLVGALVVGDSVEASLRQLALQRLGDVHLSMFTADRYFTNDLAENVGDELDTAVAPVLDLNGLAILPGQGRRTGGVHVLGVDDRFWQMGGLEGPPVDDDAPARGVVINRRLADAIDAEPGDRMLLRVARPSALSRDIPLGSEAEESVTINLPIAAIASDEQFGRYSLQASQIPPMNAYVPLELLQNRIDLGRRVNTLLVGEATTEAADAAMRQHWSLADAQAALRELEDQGVIELRSDRVFIDPPLAMAAADAARPDHRALTYFVNDLRHGERSTPYSMVGAVEPGENGPVPPDMADDEIVLNQWLADDLEAEVGDEVTVRYYLLGDARQLEEEEATFTVAGIVEVEAAGGDRHLMPRFPGVADADRAVDWNPAIPIDLNRIRDRDEAYWEAYRGAPKAFVTLAFGQATWANRFGDVTTLRWDAAGHDRGELAEAIRAEMDPAAIGLMTFDARTQALVATTEGFDFGQLFIGFSFFLIVAALLLVGLLFGFATQSRSPEIGTLLAVGWTPKQVRRAWLLEGGILAVIGSLVGLVLGVGYTRAVLWALTSEALWQDAVGATTLAYHATWSSLIIGAVSGVVVAVLTMAWVLRRSARQPVRALLAARFGAESRSTVPAHWPLWAGGALIVAAVVTMAIAGMGGDQQAAGAFFAAGSMALVGGLLGCWSLLGRTGRIESAAGGGEGGAFTVGRLGWRNSARRRGRSLATVALLACGSFLVVAVNANRQDPSADAHLPSSGTGGFALHAQSTLPVYHNLNTQDGRDHYVLDEADVEDVSFVPLRLRQGDDASCLNLNRAQEPQLMGVDPSHFADRFTFVRTQAGLAEDWSILEADLGEDVVPAVADQATAVWALGRSIGDELTYVDERGRSFQIRIVGMINNSILQGGLIIDESRLTSRYPSIGGYRILLVDAPQERADELQATLEHSLEDVGVQIMPADQRLAMFNAVENTYLSIFGTLGGLGLVLGCVGLGLVVLRNVLERRAELALMRSVGFARSRLRWLVLSEHWGLLGMGLAVGVVAALLAVWPAITGAGAVVPWPTITITLIAVIVSGVIWTLAAASAAIRGRLINALRSE